jgi:hypothetical protein
MRRVWWAAWAWWKAKARAIGVFQTKLILTLFYLLLFAPVAMIAGRLGRRRRQIGPSAPAWVPRQTRDRAWADLRRQS